jgi:uroporphyrinogen III methyltransferase/synthase
VVYLVGAGPGDAGLITVRGAELLAAADVIIYDGLVGDGLLARARPGAETLYAGKKRSGDRAPLTQAEIGALMIDRARRGLAVVRLKGGDPMIFGRAGEEMEALAAAGVRFEIVPGVSSLSAVPAYAGIALTRRGVASTVALASGHAASGKPTAAADWEALARADTAVLFMALATLEDCARRLIAAGRDPATPAAAIHWGTTAAQRTVRAPLAGIAAAVAAAGLRPPSLVVVGEVAGEARRIEWRRAMPLAGARILVPRPRERADRFAAAVACLGGEPLCAPFTRLLEADPAAGAAAAAAAPSSDWILVTSAASIERLVAALLAAGGDLRQLAGTRIACVGESTAAALAVVGLRADLIPARRSSTGLADAVLAELGEGVAGASALVVRAEGGRTEAEDRLRAAGVAVTAVALYRSAAGDPNDPAVARAVARARAGDFDVAVFFAPSQVRAYLALVGEAPPPRLVAAIGSTTADALAAAGLPAAVVASRPDPEVFAAEIATSFKDR